MTRTEIEDFSSTAIYSSSRFGKLHPRETNSQKQVCPVQEYQKVRRTSQRVRFQNIRLIPQRSGARAQ